mgnify:CR=1 FL=1
MASLALIVINLLAMLIYIPRILANERQQTQPQG